jgi:hypothetical protein
MQRLVTKLKVVTKLKRLVTKLKLKKQKLLTKKI